MKKFANVQVNYFERIVSYKYNINFLPDFIVIFVHITDSYKFVKKQTNDIN